MEGSGTLFVNEDDAKLKSFLSDMRNSQLQVIGPELIFGKIYDFIGFNKIESELFRHLVITRLFHPCGKLKAIDYLQRFLGVNKDISEIYRFLDKLSSQMKEQLEQIAFEHTRSVLGGEISTFLVPGSRMSLQESKSGSWRKRGRMGTR